MDGANAEDWITRVDDSTDDISVSDGTSVVEWSSVVRTECVNNVEAMPPIEEDGVRSRDGDSTPL